MKYLKSCIDKIIYLIDVKKSVISNQQLFKICRNFVNILEADSDPHIYHEIAEIALNSLIKNKYAKELLLASEPEKAIREILKPLTERLPTQTWRSNEQVLRQQFSTPPQIAYLLCYLLNFRNGEIVLEPSAGTGSLAVWTSGFGLETHTNEIDVRRSELLDSLGFKSTSFNAEFINDFLPAEIQPDVLMMNPPFSSNGGRTANNSSKFGFRHAWSAIERLKKGGKFGIILGNSAGLDTHTGKKFWQKLSETVRIKAIIKIAGREYSKNGTRVDVNLIIGTKYQTNEENGWNGAGNAITTVSIADIEKGFAAVRKLNLRLD